MSGMLVKEWSKGKGRGGGKTVLFLWRSPYELVLAPGRNPEKAFWRLCKRCCTAEKEGGREGGGGEEGGRKIRQYKSGLAPVGNQISLKQEIESWKARWDKSK